jgi:hypothetical protein
MSAGIEAQESNPWRRPVYRERLVQVAAESVLEDEGEPLPLVAIMKVQAIVDEGGHGLVLE